MGYTYPEITKEELISLGMDMSVFNDEKINSSDGTIMDFANCKDGNIPEYKRINESNEDYKSWIKWIFGYKK